MDFDQYQNAAKRTLYGNEQVLTNCALGLAGESGQVVDLVKNYTFRGRKLDRQQLIHEMGDVLWYLSQIAEWADIPFVIILICAFPLCPIVITLSQGSQIMQ